MITKKITGILSYITILGWIIAFLAGDKEGAKFHLNQSLVINIAWLLHSFVISAILAFIPIIGWLASLVISVIIAVIWLLGLIAACKEQEKEVPILGKIKIFK